MSAIGRGRRLAFWSYVAVLHAVVVILILKTNFLLLAGKTLGLLPPEEWSSLMPRQILRQADEDTMVRRGSVILLGDSLMAQLDARLINSDAVNFGMGGDTTRTLLARIPVIRSISSGRAVVLEVGVNDLKYRKIDEIWRDYAAVLDRISVSPMIIAISVLPVDEKGPAARERRYLKNDRIMAMNEKLRQACERLANCRFLDAWPAMRNGAVHASDGWHLSMDGNRVLAGLVRNALMDGK